MKAMASGAFPIHLRSSPPFLLPLYDPCDGHELMIRYILYDLRNDDKLVFQPNSNIQAH
jgi:hypothetical protein